MNQVDRAEAGTERSSQQAQNLAENAVPRQPLNLQKYFRMGDPKAAAMLLLEDAVRLGWDVNVANQSQYSTKPGRTQNFHLYFTNGDIDPDPVDKSFVAQMAAASSKGPDRRVTILLQYNRKISVAELASILDSGVRVLESHPPLAVIAHAPVSQISALSQFEFMRWIGPYSATYKYRPQDIKANRETLVYSLDGNRKEFRNDLADLDFSIKEFSPVLGAYVITAGPESVAGVAELWWVRNIHQHPYGKPIFQREPSGETRSN